MGSQVRGWSGSPAISAHGLRIVVVRRGEVLSWTRGGRNPLPTALESTISEMVRAAWMGAVIPSQLGPGLNPVRRDAANAIGWLRRNREEAWPIGNGL
ncbi:hypothetical protein A4X06_0g8276 [Tilletia controversa]|uniref:Uncharacterized protein n=1 Tax=Tilletia controversa TaxID=13291 RepID=A0A8X7MLB3_9BASI|nr:hypothetical protein A4X06_0g8276 [Tilletia controversa]